MNRVNDLARLSVARPLGYQPRLVIVCCVLCIACVTACTSFVASILTQRATELNGERIRAATDIGYSLIIQDRDRNLTNAQLLAARTTVQDAISNETTANLQDEFLEPNRVLMQLDFVSLIGPDNRVIGQAQRIRPPMLGEIGLIRSALTGGRTASGIADVGGQTWLLASAPIIRDNKAVGAVVVGRIVDDAYITSLSKRLGGYQAALVRNDSLIAASSGFQSALAAAHLSRPGNPTILSKGDGWQTWQIGKEPFDVDLRPLGGGSQATFALGESHSDDAVVSADARRLIALFCAGVLILAIGLAIAGVRWSLRPVRRLAAVLARASEGGPSEAGDDRLPSGAGGLGAAAEALMARSRALDRLVSGQQERLEAILNGMPIGIVVGENGEGVSFANTAARDMLGLSATPPDGAAMLNGKIDGISEGVRTLEAVNGRMLSAITASVKTTDELPPAHLTVLQDVTREHQLDQMRSDFLSTVSHELRTPLTSIKSSIELLLDEDAGEIAPLQRRFLLTVQRNAERLIELVTEILDLSRIESGQVQLHLNPIDVRRIVDDVAMNLSNLFDSKRQVVDVDVPSDPLFVQADRRRFEQVVTNLLANAGLYTPEGGHIRVSAAAVTDRPAVHISVRDDGPGIPPEEQAHLFEKFYRGGHTLTRQDGGTGLGLAIVKSLVDLHQGSVTVRSEIGQGTCFTVELPRLEGVPV